MKDHKNCLRLYSASVKSKGISLWHYTLVLWYSHRQNIAVNQWFKHERPRSSHTHDRGTNTGPTITNVFKNNSSRQHCLLGSLTMQSPSSQSVVSVTYISGTYISSDAKSRYNIWMMWSSLSRCLLEWNPIVFQIDVIILFSLMRETPADSHNYTVALSPHYQPERGVCHTMADSGWLGASGFSTIWKLEYSNLSFTIHT